jgi:hypothetical protein
MEESFVNLTCISPTPIYFEHKGLPQGDSFYLCVVCTSKLWLMIIPLVSSNFSKTGRWFSPGTPVSSTYKTVHHNITEILLKVALNTITLTLRQIPMYFYIFEIQSNLL